MADFETWKPENLIRFAQEASERLVLLQNEVDALKVDMRTAINAYRDVLINQATHLPLK
jgi:hypothetical protein